MRFLSVRRFKFPSYSFLPSAFAVLLAFSPFGSSQEVPPPKPDANTKTDATPSATKPSNPDQKAEVNIQDSGTTFHLRVNLVQVHVVVRDAQGKPVENLRKEDFLLYDQGKLQTISTFAVETRQSRRAKSDAAVQTQLQDEEEAGKPASAVLPDRFVALVFDDTHLAIEDTTNVRVQVMKFIDDLPATDRAAIYSTSGQLSHNFTGDKEALKKTIMGLTPRPRYSNSTNLCPDISHYEADQVVNKSNDQVLGVIAEEVIQCQFNGDETKRPQAIAVARTATQETLINDDNESEYNYTFMNEVLRHLAGMPGERVMVLVSPGFLLTTQSLQMTATVDRANRSGIVINTIDGRGLYTPDMLGDISQRASDTSRTVGYKATYRTAAQTEQAYVLGDLAYGTGGSYFHNSNDLAGGFQMVGAAPEVSYVLGFSPQNQKMDGQFHTLKVTITEKRKFAVQARRGYFAQKKAKNPDEQAREEIQEAVFSRDEILDLALKLQTQYFKGDGVDAHLSVVSRLDLGNIHFRKAEGRNFDDLTLATAIFDDNGNFVIGNEKIVQMKLLDATYTRMIRSGFVVKSSFDVKPGKYMIRQVVRDSEGSQMAAQNGAVEIPN